MAYNRWTEIKKKCPCAALQMTKINITHAVPTRWTEMKIVNAGENR